MEDQKAIVQQTGPDVFSVGNMPQALTFSQATAIANIINREGPGYEFQRSATAEARKLLADCKGRNGQIHESSLLSGLTSIFLTLFRVQARLPASKNIETGELTF